MVHNYYKIAHMRLADRARMVEFGHPLRLATLAASPSLCEGEGWLFPFIHQHVGGDFGFLFFILFIFVGLLGWAVLA